MEEIVLCIRYEIHQWNTFRNEMADSFLSKVTGYIMYKCSKIVNNRVLPVQKNKDSTKKVSLPSISALAVSSNTSMSLLDAADRFTGTMRRV